MSVRTQVGFWAAVVLLAVLAAAAVFWLQNRQPQVPDGYSNNAQAATLVRVVDADTLVVDLAGVEERVRLDRKSTRLNSSHVASSYAVFCLKKKKLISGSI